MEIHNYPNTASTINNGSFFDIDQKISSSPDVFQSQKLPASVVKALMLSENIELLTVSQAQAKVAGTGGAAFVSLKTYIVDAAAGGDRILKLLAANGVTNQCYQAAIDLTTGEIGTYDITTDVFTPMSESGTYTPTLTPDGTVITAAPDVELALYSAVGGVGNVSISMKNIDADFSAGGGANVGSITIDTFPIPTGTPYFIGSAELKVGGSITMPSLPLYASLKVDGTIELYCDDLTFSFTGGRITVNFQYPIN